MSEWTWMEIASFALKRKGFVIEIGVRT